MRMRLPCLALLSLMAISAVPAHAADPEFPAHDTWHNAIGFCGAQSQMKVEVWGIDMNHELITEHWSIKDPDAPKLLVKMMLVEEGKKALFDFPTAGGVTRHMANMEDRAERLLMVKTAMASLQAEFGIPESEADAALRDCRGVILSLHQQLFAILMMVTPQQP